jgi:RsiW-degrading membrane proteinase PrsW (M82 family)
MLFLAKALAIAVLVWFYTTAREKGEPPINWAITGLIGYVIVWVAVRYTVVHCRAWWQKALQARLLLCKYPQFVRL